MLKFKSQVKLFAINLLGFESSMAVRWPVELPVRLVAKTNQLVLNFDQLAIGLVELLVKHIIE